MKKLILLMAVICSLPLQAQVDQEIKDLLVSIRRELNSPQDQRTLLRVRERLSDTLQLLTDSPNPNPNPGPIPRSSLSCIARDNDGRAPWVLGVRDPRTLQTQKLPQSNVGELATCEQVKPIAVNVRNSLFVCITKDNDGRDPWALAHYRDGELVSKVNNIGTMSNCVASLQQAIFNSQAIAFCATSDNDGRAPWTQMSVVAETGETHKNGSFSTQDQCLRAKIKISL